MKSETQTTVAAHTPGPWVFHPSDCDGWFLVQAHSKAGRIVANVNQESCPDSASAPAFVRMPAEANARLIAAAPDLLAALLELERITSAHPSMQNEWTHAASAIGAARAAIAKAEGKQ